VIFDQLIHADAYRHLGERFAAAFDYLRSSDFTHIPDDRYEIIGSDGYAIVQSYDSKPMAKGRWEAHRKFADIQYIVTGRERMGVTLIEQVKVQQRYDAGKDLEFFTGEGQFFIVEQGSFAVFFPQDVHMPALAVDDELPEHVKKVVVKVPL
jgi:YhcH/YjgK/YiaL family protein